MEEEISLQEIIDLLTDHWRFIVGVTLAAIVLMALYTTLLVTPKYQSSTTLIVGKPDGYSNTANSGSTYNEVMTNQQLVGTYSEIAKSQTIASQVIANLHLSYTDAELAKMIDVATVNDTELIQITVTSNDPNEAAKIADETAKVFMENISGLMKINNLQTVDPAVIKPNPVSPSLMKNIAIALLGGLVISIAFVFIREMLSTSVKSVDELKDIVGDIPIVAAIPHAQELMED